MPRQHVLPMAEVPPVLTVVPATEAEPPALVDAESVPGVLIGRNADISWPLTDAQNQSTVFYSEQTSPDHPGQYYWNNAWHPMERVEYTIPVRGGDAEHFAVDLTVHGPVLTRAGQTTSVDWMGNIPSPDLAVLLSVKKARD
ncbi:penicillin acylase family protein [Kitasatospora sp. NPDC059577]|uniref:penicillin acylase family protein n=1 Tax=unclassified Kitasatospora TaxID=2633591 RepID=UPI0036CC96F5